MLDDHRKEILLMQELWKLGAYQECYKSRPCHTQNWRTQTDALEDTCRSQVFPRPDYFTSI